MDILHIEDSEDDAWLVTLALERAGLNVSCVRVETATDLAIELGRRKPDICLCDCAMPRLDPSTAIDIVHRFDEDLPVILVSGNIGEDSAINLSRLGAVDFVHKSQLSRLAATIDRALRERSERRMRKEAERALREEERRYRGIFEGAGEAILVLDEEWTIESVNPAASRKFRSEASELVGRSIFTLLSETARPALLEALEARPVAGARRCEVRGLRAGSSFPVELSLSVLELDDAPRIVVFARDLTEQKKLQAELLESQKMEAIGRLAGGVAHDFNNLLCVILSYTETMADGVASPEEQADDLAEIRRASERASQLTRQLLAFARRTEADPKPNDLASLLGEMRKFLGRVVGDNVELGFSVAPELWPVEIDAGQFEQVVLNLVVNARDALPSGGHIRVVCENVDAESARARGGLAAPDGDCVELSVVDDGAGMSNETMQRAFEPFFTTKGPGLGTGLGLATCHGIVHRFGGHIWAESALDAGTTLHVLLPRARGMPASASQLRAAAPHGKGETILLVEDDDGVRQATTRVLKSFGYSVLSASSAKEALAIFEKQSGAIAAVVSDVVMMHTSGPEMISDMLATRPRLPVVFVTGHAEESVLTGISEHPRREQQLLFKPFSPAALAEKLRDLLAMAASTAG